MLDRRSSCTERRKVRSDRYSYGERREGVGTPDPHGIASPLAIFLVGGNGEKNQWAVGHEPENKHAPFRHQGIEFSDTMKGNWA
jgi:hypothetical protein